MNERKQFFIKIYLSHFILERGDVGCVWEMSWGRRYIDPAVLLSHLGWVAQLWVTEGPKPSVCRCLSIRHLVPNWLKPSVSWLHFCLMYTCFRCSSAYLHWCVSWLTARSRVNILHIHQLSANTDVALKTYRKQWPIGGVAKEGRIYPYW